MATSGRSAGAPVAAVGREHYELFVTYAQADRAWVYGFMLPALGLAEDRVITAEQFRPGAPVVDEFERAVTSSRYTVVVVSNAYLADAWTTFGEQLTSYASVGGADRLIPAVIEPCEVPLRVEFRVRLDLTDESRWEEQLARLRELLERSAPGLEELPCPYPGMQVFTQDQQQWFYGREDESELLLRRLRQQSLVVVIGPSGAGKSSLVFAGVLPQLGRGGRGGERWVIRSLRPGPHPTQALAAALETDPGEPQVGQRASEVGEAAAALRAREVDGRLLLVVDQLEEVFAQADRAEQTAFFDRLLVLRHDPRCVLLFTVRADFYAELMTCPLWPLGPGERFEVVPLAGAALARAIQQPAADVGVHLETELVQRLVDDAAGEPGVLPFVQETLVLLWHQRRRRLLTEVAYDRLGGEGRSALTAAIAEKADATVSALTPRQRAIARRILLRLVQLGEGRQDTRRQEQVEALHSSAESRAEFEATLQHLTANRLLTLSGQESDRPRVDLAHEALITGWPQLHDWIRDNRDNLRMQRATFEDAQHWQELGRDPEALYRGARLEAAGTWADAHHDELNDLERDFIRASREDAAARRRRQRRTALLLRGLSAFLLLAVVAVSYLGVQARSRAAENERLASRYLAVQANAYEPFDHDLIASFDAEGNVFNLVLPSDRPEAHARVARWDVRSGEPTTVRLGTTDAQATSIAFSADGTAVAWAYARNGAGEVVVWDLELGRRIGDPMSDLSGYVYDLTFAEGRSVLAWTESVDYTLVDIVRWDLEAGRRQNPAWTPEDAANLGFVASSPSLSANGEVAVLETWVVGHGRNSEPGLLFWDVRRSRPVSEPVPMSAMSDADPFGEASIEVRLTADGRAAVVLLKPHGDGGSEDVSDLFLWGVHDGERRSITGEPPLYATVVGQSEDGRTLFVELGSFVGTGSEETVQGSLLAVDVASGRFVGEPFPVGDYVNIDAIDDIRSILATVRYEYPDPPDDDEPLNGVPEDYVLEGVEVALWDMASGRPSGEPVILGEIEDGDVVKVWLNPAGSRHAIAVYPWDGSFETGRVMFWDASTGAQVDGARIGGS
jgi:hypothetical protein